MSTPREKILEQLQALGIDFTLHTHPPLFTAEDAAYLGDTLSGGHGKSLFLRNRSGNQHYLFIVELSERADLKALARHVDESQLGFASPERLERYLQVVPGSVSPFGLMFDAEAHVITLFDEGLLRHDRLNFHPNDNTATVNLSREDFLRFLESTGHPIRPIPRGA